MIKEYNGKIIINEKEYIYNPKIFEMSSVLAWSIRDNKINYPEQYFKLLDDCFNIKEINFIGPKFLVIKIKENEYFRIEYNDKSIKKIRLIKFISFSSKNYYDILSYPYKNQKSSTTVLNKFPISIEKIVSLNSKEQLRIEYSKLRDELNGLKVKML